MDGCNLSTPNELVFTNSTSPLQVLTLENNSLEKMVFKIRTNHKTALSLNSVHDFINPMSKKEIPVKLIEIHEGVKLEVNYTKATEQMIIKNDPKMTGVDKKLINKSIVPINVSGILQKKFHTQEFSSKNTEIDQENLPSNFTSQGISVDQMSQSSEKSTNMSFQIPKKTTTTSEILHIVEQHPEQDEEELQERKKHLESLIAQSESELKQERSRLNEKKKAMQAEIEMAKANQIISLPILLCILTLTFFLGHLMKQILY